MVRKCDFHIICDGETHFELEVRKNKQINETAAGWGVQTLNCKLGASKITITFYKNKHQHKWIESWAGMNAEDAPDV